jgi:hypothetical protein
MMMKTDTKPTSITKYDEATADDAAAVNWLTEKLAAAREQGIPGAEAIARMRARVLDEASRKRSRKIAA